MSELMADYVLYGVELYRSMDRYAAQQPNAQQPYAAPDKANWPVGLGLGAIGSYVASSFNRLARRLEPYPNRSAACAACMARTV